MSGYLTYDSPCVLESHASSIEWSRAPGGTTPCRHEPSSWMMSSGVLPRGTPCSLHRLCTRHTMRCASISDPKKQLSLTISLMKLTAVVHSGRELRAYIHSANPLSSVGWDRLLDMPLKGPAYTSLARPAQRERCRRSSLSFTIISSFSKAWAWSLLMPKLRHVAWTPPLEH